MMASLVSCKKDFQEPLQISVPEMELKATIVVVEGESIQDAINLAEDGDVIEIQQGTYNEDLNLKSGPHYTLNFQNVIVNDDGPVITDRIEDGRYYETVPVTVDIVGTVTFVSGGSGFNGVADFRNFGTVINALGDINIHRTSGGGNGLEIGNASGSWIDTDTTTTSILMTTGSVGLFYGPDNGVNHDFTFEGKVHALYAGPWIATAAFEVAGGSLEGKLILSGYFLAENYYGGSISGSNLYIHDAVIESKTGIANWQEFGGDPLWVYSGNHLTFGPNVTLLGSTKVAAGTSWFNGIWSIGNESASPSNAAEITTTDTLWVNMPYVTAGTGPNGETYTDLNWAVGSEDLVYSIPPKNIVVTKNFKGRYKTVKFDWEGIKANPTHSVIYDIYKDGFLIGSTETFSYTDTVTGSFKESLYKIETNIDVVNNGFREVFVTKK